MTERWRCFVALPIGDSLRSDLAAAVAGWRDQPDLAGLRWTAPESWHVTLAFLGSIPASSVMQVAERISGVTAAHAPMACASGGLGAFPKPPRARVAWYGIADADGRLAALAADLWRTLELDAGGPFHPHVTLARARGAPIDLRTWLATASAPSGELVVDRLHLMRSHLGAGPARYETLALMQLGMHVRD